MVVQTILVALVLAGTTLAVLPPPVAAQALPTWCVSQSSAGAPLFCDDFITDLGWTKAGTGLQACSSDVGQCYNPTDWLKSKRSNDYGYPGPNGDGNSWFVGVQANGEDLGYLSPQPFGLFLGGITGCFATCKGAAWYAVTNTLTSPVIDGTGAALTSLSFSARGSSEGSEFDRLDVYIDVMGGGTVQLASLSGISYQNTWYTFPSSAAWLSNQKFQFRFVFTQDANTDSVTPPPCLAVPVPNPVPGGPPPLCPLPALICNPTLFSGSGCLYGGMGFWVDDVIVRKVTKPPTASFMFEVKTNCIAPWSVDFTDLSFDPDGTVEWWDWNFGDGQTASNQNPQHDYQNPGKYNVTLKIMDNEGNMASIALLIVIIAGECADDGSGEVQLPSTKPQANAAGLRAPHDGVDASVAEGDVDGDGALDGLDVCPMVSDPAQTDSDGDNMGDACDIDADGDLTFDVADNCRGLANGGQADRDADSKGDACDDDADGDAIANAKDNCAIANPDQADLDGNSVGDACQIMRSTPGAASEASASRDLVRDAAPVSAASAPAAAGSANATWSAFVLAGAAVALALAVLIRRRP